MTNRNIWLVKISKDKTPMLENFKECVENGKTASRDLIDQLKRRGLQNVEEFIIGDRIRFWRFVGDLYPNVSEGDILLFLLESENKLFVSIASNTIKDYYQSSKKNYELLDCPNPLQGVFSLVTLIKPIKILNAGTKGVQNNIIDKIHKNGSLVRGDYLWRYSHSDEIIRTLLHVNLKEFLNSEGYQVPDYLIAQFYVALKTKGFVILSGLSGTGKTKIALKFVELLTKDLPTEIVEVMRSSGGMFKPEEEIKKLRETIDQKGFAVKYFDYDEKIKDYLRDSFVLWIYNSNRKSNNYQKVVMGLWVTDIKEGSYNDLPNEWKDRLRWIEDVYEIDIESELAEKKLYVKIKDVWEVNENIDSFKDVETGEWLSTKDASKMGKRFRKVKSREGLIPLKQKNYIFLPARPDWRDSKPLLGYYNPLDKRYYKTSLLELILRAIEDYKQNREKAMPYFIILDEMNLAHVEYYFADFLSVLETGRDNNGFTVESIKLHNVNEVERKQRVPKEIKLPPNLYVIGTVNIDETTYMFSPKVLDRAFMIEFHDVDIANYPSVDLAFDYSDLRDRILEDLRNGGKFLTYANKERIKTALQELPPQYWQILQNFNKALEPYDLHFGYRVVDEIALFFKNAKESQEKGIIIFESEDEIFDSALLMKILPKFHGNRKKLEKPLKEVLKICLKDGQTFEIETLSSEKIVKILQNWDEERQKFKFPHTAKKVLRMLRQLYEIGFASFG